jgi:hypothetical protein
VCVVVYLWWVLLASASLVSLGNLSARSSLPILLPRLSTLAHRLLPRLTSPLQTKSEVDTPFAYSVCQFPLERSSLPNRPVVIVLEILEILTLAASWIYHYRTVRSVHLAYS